MKKFTIKTETKVVVFVEDGSFDNDDLNETSVWDLVRPHYEEKHVEMIIPKENKSLVVASSDTFMQILGPEDVG